MKKRLLSGLLGGLMVMSLVACNDTTQSAVDVDYSSYMTLGEYKGLEATATTSVEVTEDEMQQYIDNMLTAMAETEQIKEGTVKDGDTINMDFSGLLDGVAFANGTATDYTYTVGGNFIEDLDRGLVGLEIGKEYEIPCKFPENYGEETLNGKDVIFVVTVNYVENKIIPEFNDEFVKKATAESDEVLNTTEEMKASIKEYLTAQKKAQRDSEIYVSVMEQIINVSEVKSFPQSDVDDFAEMIKANAEAEFETYGQLYGVSTFEEFIAMMGYETMEAYEAEVVVNAQETVKEKMALSLIAQNEKMIIANDEIETYANDLAKQLGYQSVAELEKTYGENFYKDVKFDIMCQMVLEFLVENSVVK